jgi:hypothetical protein
MTPKRQTIDFAPETKIRKLREGDFLTKVNAATEAGVKLPVDVTDVAQALQILDTVRVNEARDALIVAEAALAEAKAAQTLADQAAVLDHIFDRIATVPMADDEIGPALTEVDQAQRRERAVRANRDRATLDLKLELRSPKVHKALAARWREVLTWEPTDETPWSEIQSQGAQKAAAIYAVRRLLMETTPEEGPSPLKKAMTEMLDAEPVDLPDWSTVEKALYAPREEEVEAVKAEKDAKAAQRALDRAMASAAAGKRTGTGPGGPREEKAEVSA